MRPIDISSINSFISLISFFLIACTYVDFEIPVASDLDGQAPRAIS